MLFLATKLNAANANFVSLIKQICAGKSDLQLGKESDNDGEGWMLNDEF